MKYSEYRKTMSDCPFCEKGRRGHALAENDSAFLTYALAPYHPDHFLVIPKRHTEWLLDITEREMKDIDALQKKALEILRKFGYKNISLLVREGDGSAKSVPHLHYHAIPDIRLGDTDHVGLDRTVMTDDEVSALMEKVRNALSN